MDYGDIYRNRISPDEERVLESQTRSKSWDYSQFRQVLISLGVLGGISVPAHNRPDLISIDGWSQQVNDLRMRTQSTGREHARVLLVDKEKQKLFFSGKITAGSSTQTSLDYSTESGREFFQRPIASIHTHPLEQGTMVAHGFSGQDYRTFLGHAEQQAMVIALVKET